MIRLVCGDQEIEEVCSNVIIGKVVGEEKGSESVGGGKYDCRWNERPCLYQ